MLYRINTKNGKTKLTGTATVANASAVKQKFKNDPTVHMAFHVPNPVIVTVNKSLYKVSASGAADLKLSCVIDVDLLLP